MVQLSYPYMTTGKTKALTIQTFDGKVMALFFNSLCRFVIAFLPRSKHLLISWLQSMFTVILEPKKIKSSLFPLFPYLFAMHLWDRMSWSYFFWMLNFKPVSSSHFPLAPLSTGSLVPLCFLPLGWCHLHIWGYWYFSWKSWFQLEIHPAWHFICWII